MTKRKIIKLVIEGIYEKIKRVTPDKKYASGLCMEGYLGGYLQGVMDAQALFCSDYIPENFEEYLNENQ